MIYESEKNGLVDLEKMLLLRKDYLAKSMKALLVFLLPNGQATWAYDTSDDRDKEYNEIKKALKLR